MLNRLRLSNQAHSTTKAYVAPASAAGSASLSSDMYVEMPRPKSPAPAPPRATPATNSALLEEIQLRQSKAQPPRPARAPTMNTSPAPALLQPSRTPERHTRTVSEGHGAVAKPESHPPPPPSMKQRPALRKMSSSGTLDSRERGSSKPMPVPGAPPPVTSPPNTRPLRAQTVLGVSTSDAAADYHVMPPRPTQRKPGDQPSAVHPPHHHPHHQHPPAPAPTNLTGVRASYAHAPPAPLPSRAKLSDG